MVTGVPIWVPALVRALARAPWEANPAAWRADLSFVLSVVVPVFRGMVASGGVSDCMSDGSPPGAAWGGLQGKQ